MLSLVKAKPEWSLLGVTHLEQMPAPRWKLENLLRLREANPGKFTGQSTALQERIE